MSSKMSTESSRSWFCVLNNPSKQFGDIEPREMVLKAIELWCDDKPQRTCAINYEIGDNGTPHMHMVLEDPSKTRFSALQKLYQGIHISVTRGTKEQAEDYINKRGNYEDKKHTVVVPPIYRGTIKANKGIRNDLDVIKELIEKGLTPNQIMDQSIHYRKQESIIRDEYFRKRYLETPIERTVNVIWHVGKSGCGKSHSYFELCESQGDDNVYFYTDFDKGGFDRYNGERILFIDEFKGNIKFSTLLGLLDGYRIQLSCRYSNRIALWTEVHITSVYPPEIAYKFMVNTENRKLDSDEQLLRRIDTVVYHYKENAEYKTFAVTRENYTTYDILEQMVHGNVENPFNQTLDCNQASLLD